MRGDTFIGKACNCGSSVRRVSNKNCVMCSRSAAMENYTNNRESRLLSMKRYYVLNSEKIKAYVSEYRLKNHDSAWKIKNADRLRLYQKRTRAKHKDVLRGKYAKWLADNPNYHRDWRNRNMLRVRAYCQARYARLCGANGRYTVEDVMRLLSEQNFRCQYCCMTLPARWDIDHKIPLIRGGDNDATNICIACVPCNRKKSASFPDTFALRLLGAN